jgi:hypothetical protein
MTPVPRRALFVQRHLDPANRLGEILFGLIMALSITLTAGLSAADGPQGSASYCRRRGAATSRGALSTVSCTS